MIDCGSRFARARVAAAHVVSAMLVSGCLVGGVAADARAKTIAGTVMTAQHPDSFVARAPVVLIFREGQDATRRLQAEADERGHFHFTELAADTSINYVLSIDHRGQQFLSAPIRFRPEQEIIEFNVLLSAGMDPGAMPSGHPPIEDPGPRFGKPVKVDPAHTILLVLGITAAFFGLGMAARRRVAASSAADLPAHARPLVRDIASLDINFGEGIIGEEEYRKVRAQLMERLRGIEKGGRAPTAGDARVSAGQP